MSRINTKDKYVTDKENVVCLTVFFCNTSLRYSTPFSPIELKARESSVSVCNKCRR